MADKDKAEKQPPKDHRQVDREAEEAKQKAGADALNKLLYGKDGKPRPLP